MSKKKAESLIRRMESRRDLHISRGNQNPNKYALAFELNDVMNLIRDEFGIDRPDSEAYYKGEIIKRDNEVIGEIDYRYDGKFDAHVVTAKSELMTLLGTYDKHDDADIAIRSYKHDRLVEEGYLKHL